MKVCPNCGCIDYSMWRQNRWRTNVEFLKMEYADPENIAPVVLAELKEKRVATDKYYAYRFSGKSSQPIIERVIRQEFDCAGLQAFHIPREKQEFHNKDVYQKKLLAFVIKEVKVVP